MTTHSLKKIDGSKKKSKRKFKKYPEENENGNTTYNIPKFMECRKILLREKFIVTNIYLKKEIFQIKTLHLMELEITTNNCFVCSAQIDQKEG